jgi:hypothetical protein
MLQSIKKRESIKNDEKIRADSNLQHNSSIKRSASNSGGRGKKTKTMGLMSCMFVVMVVVSIRIIYIIVMANMWELAERRTAVLVHPVLSPALLARAASGVRIRTPRRGRRAPCLWRHNRTRVNRRRLGGRRDTGGSRQRWEIDRRVPVGPRCMWDRDHANRCARSRRH